jgi:hypothetical protein
MTRVPDPTKITYKGKVPKWIKRAVTKYKKLFGLDSWKIEVRVMTQRSINKKFAGEERPQHFNTIGHTHIDNAYKYATIYFSSTIKPYQDEDTIFHEMRHIYYFWYFDDLVSNTIIQALPQSKRDELRAIYDDHIETLIEEDWRTQFRSTRRRVTT